MCFFYFYIPLQSLHWAIKLLCHLQGWCWALPLLLPILLPSFTNSLQCLNHPSKCSTKDPTKASHWSNQKKEPCFEVQTFCFEIKMYVALPHLSFQEHWFSSHENSSASKPKEKKRGGGDAKKPGKGEERCRREVEKPGEKAASGHENLILLLIFQAFNAHPWRTADGQRWQGQWNEIKGGQECASNTKRQ